MTIAPPPTVTPARNTASDTATAAAPPALQCTDLAAGYDGRAVVHDFTCALRRGEVVGVVGPNGCGKSTLLRAWAGQLRPIRGRVLLDGEDLASLPRRTRARSLALLPQHPQAPPGLTVRDLVRFGRAPHARWLEPFGPEDHAVVARALDHSGLAPLADHPLNRLSGGQRQQAWIAMTIAQQSHVLLLDEPTSALDIRHQLDVMHLLRHLAPARGLAVAVVLHDLDLAVRFCDRLLVVAGGRLAGACRPTAATDWSLLEATFNVRATVLRDPGTGGPPRLAFERA